jgi:hypothetical protein
MSDGIKKSRLHTRRDTPFGKEFSYTDASDLPGSFTDPGSTGRYKKGGVHLTWRQRLLNRFRRKPIGWAVVEFEDDAAEKKWHSVTAQMAPNGEIKTSIVEPRAMIPVYDDNVILAMDIYEKEQEKSPHSSST